MSTLPGPLGTDTDPAVLHAVAWLSLVHSQPSPTLPLMSAWPPWQAWITHAPAWHPQVWTNAPLHCAAAPSSTWPSQSSSSVLQVSCCWLGWMFGTQVDDPPLHCVLP